MLAGCGLVMALAGTGVLAVNLTGGDAGEVPALLLLTSGIQLVSGLLMAWVFYATRVEADAEGLTAPNRGFGRRRIRWSEVQEVRPVDRAVLDKFVRLTTRDGERAACRSHSPPPTTSSPCDGQDTDSRARSGRRPRPDR